MRRGDIVLGIFIIDVTFNIVSFDVGCPDDRLLHIEIRKCTMRVFHRFQLMAIKFVV